MYLYFLGREDLAAGEGSSATIVVGAPSMCDTFLAATLKWLVGYVSIHTREVHDIYIGRKENIVMVLSLDECARKVQSRSYGIYFCLFYTFVS